MACAGHQVRACPGREALATQSGNKQQGGMWHCEWHTCHTCPRPRPSNESVTALFVHSSRHGTRRSCSGVPLASVHKAALPQKCAKVLAKYPDCSLIASRIPCPRPSLLARYYDIIPGGGAEARIGERVAVHYDLKWRNIT